MTGANFDNSRGLSEEGIMLLVQRGDYRGIGKKEIEELILDDEKSHHHINKTIEIDMSGRPLRPESFRMFERNSSWLNLARLDLSWNNIFYKGDAKIAKNSAWKNLQELLLNSSYAVSIADYSW